MTQKACTWFSDPFLEFWLLPFLQSSVFACLSIHLTVDTLKIPAHHSGTRLNIPKMLWICSLLLQALFSRYANFTWIWTQKGGENVWPSWNELTGDSFLTVNFYQETIPWEGIDESPAVEACRRSSSHCQQLQGQVSLHLATATARPDAPAAVAPVTGATPQLRCTTEASHVDSTGVCPACVAPDGSWGPFDSFAARVGSFSLVIRPVPSLLALIWMIEGDFDSLHLSSVQYTVPVQTQSPL